METHMRRDSSYHLPFFVHTWETNWFGKKENKKKENEMKWNEKRRNNCENLEILYIKKLINNFWYVFIITNLLPHLVQSIMLILNVFSFNSRV